MRPAKGFADQENVMFQTFFTKRTLTLVVLSLLVAAVVLSCSDSVSNAKNSSALAVGINAVDTVTDVAGTVDGNADPGDTLEYTVTVTNTGLTDAANTQFNSTLSSLTTLVGGSIKVTPIAVSDTYSVLGNVSIAPLAANGLLANDLSPLTGSNSGLTVSGPATTTAGGNMTLSSNGAFTYNPPAGFEGADTYTYTVTDTNGTSSTGIATFNVSGMIWFVNNGAAACTSLAAGCGRLSSPFSTLAALQVLNNGTGNNPASGDNIFIYENSTTYLGGITLLTAQKLIGQDSTSSLNVITGLTPPAYSATLPVMNIGGSAVTIANATGSVVNLANNAIIRGLTVNCGGGSVTGMTGSALATAVVGSDVAINNCGQSAFTLSGAATGNIDVGATISGNSGTAVVISNRTGGIINFTGSISSTGQGISLTSNTNGTINFTGGVSLSTAANPAFVATGGGTVNITGSSNTLTTTTATALNFNATNIGSSGLTFLSINSSGTSNNTGIVLDNTGTAAGNGGLKVTGASTAGSGGTIANKTGGNTTSYNTSDGRITVNSGVPIGIGIFLRSTKNPSFSRMQMNAFSNYAIYGESVNGFTLANSIINGTAGDTVNVATSSPPEGSIFFTDIIGTASITGSTVSNTVPTNNSRIIDTIHVMNNGGALTLFNIDGSTISNIAQAGGPGGKDAIFFGTPSGLGSGSMNLTINNSNVTAAYQFLTQVNIQGAATSTVNITGSHFTDTNENIANGIVSAGGGVNLTGGGSAANYVKYLVSGNTFQHNSGANPGATNAGALLITGIASGSGTFDGRIVNNTFGVTGVARSGAGPGADALRIFASGNNGSSGASSVLVAGNTIKNYGEVGIQFNARQGNAGLNATVLGNTINEPGTAAAGAFGAIWVNAGALGSDTNAVNIAIGGTNSVDKNTMANSDPSGATDVFLDKASCSGCASTINLYRNGSTATGSGETLVRNVLTEDNVGTLNLSNGFTGGTINVLNGLPPQPSVMPIDQGDSSDNKASLGITGLGTTGDILAVLVDMFVTDHGKIGPAAAISSNEPMIAFGEAIPTTATNINDRGMIASASEISTRIFDGMFPTVSAQSRQDASANDGSKRSPASPESGETVTIAGSGAGFTLPAGSSTTIKYRATVNNGPYASGIDSITNSATLSGTNFTPVTSNTATIALDAAPDLSVTTSNGLTDVQVGQLVTYTLNYGNATGNNLQDAAGVVLTETVPINSTFSAAGSSAGWSCADGSAGGTVCTKTIGNLAAGTGGTATFATQVITAMPRTEITFADTASLAESPANFNGTDLTPANNSSTKQDPVRGIWLGGTSVAYEVATNWSNNLLPVTPQSVSIASGAGSAPTVSTGDITVNTIFLGKALTINSGRMVTANASVALTNQIVTGAGTLEIAQGGTITRTTGQVNSALKMNFLNGSLAPEAPAANVTFPIGTAGAYSPVTLNVTAGTGSLTAKANTGLPTSVPVMNAAKSLNRYWTLSGTGITADVQFNYLASDVPVTATEANLYLVRVVGGGVPFGIRPNGTSLILDTAAHSIRINGIQAFNADWTAAEPLAPVAANVGITGRVLDMRGRGLSGALITVTDANGNVQYSRTNPFGYYHVLNQSAGSTVIIAPTSKQFTYQPRTITVEDNVTDLDFTPDSPQPAPADRSDQQ